MRSPKGIIAAFFIGVYAATIVTLAGLTLLAISGIVHSIRPMLYGPEPDVIDFFEEFR